MSSFYYETLSKWAKVHENVRSAGRGFLISALGLSAGTLGATGEGSGPT